MCNKFLVLTKSCRSQTDGPALVSDTGDDDKKQCSNGLFNGSDFKNDVFCDFC